MKFFVLKEKENCFAQSRTDAIMTTSKLFQLAIKLCFLSIFSFQSAVFKQQEKKQRIISNWLKTTFDPRQTQN